MAETAMTVAGVDVGGTNIGAGLVSDAHEVLDRAKAATPTDGPDAVLDVIAELVSSLDGRPDAVGVGIPGVVHNGEVLTVPNLVNWHERIDIAAGLEDRLGTGSAGQRCQRGSARRVVGRRRPRSPQRTRGVDGNWHRRRADPGRTPVPWITRRRRGAGSCDCRGQWGAVLLRSTWLRRGLCRSAIDGRRGRGDGRCRPEDSPV